MWVLPFLKLDGFKPSSLWRSHYFLAFPFFSASRASSRSRSLMIRR